MIDTTKQVKEITYNGTPLVLYQEPREDAILQSKSFEIIQNGTYSTVPDSGYDGLSSVDITVNVPIPEVEEPALQDKLIEITSNGTLNITPDEGYDGLSSVAVTVNVPSSGGGTSLLDNYSVVYAYKTTLTALNSNYTISTSSFGTGSSSYYYYYLVQDTIPVGASILDYITKKSSYSTYAICRPIYSYKGGSGTAPSEMTMDVINTGPYSIRLYKYSNITYSAGTADIGNLVLFDDDGICLFNGTWEDGIAALNNKTIDASNGVTFTSTSAGSTGTAHSVVFS